MAYFLRELIIISLLLCVSIGSFACNITITVIAIDSLGGEKINNYIVYIDETEFYLPEDGTNILKFTLDFSKKKSYNIRIAPFSSYEGSEFKLTVPLDCKDTTIIVGLLYIFHPRQLPVFFFKKNEIYPDTTNLKNALESASYLCKVYKNAKLFFQINGSFYPNEIRTNEILILERINYIKTLLINFGADTNKIEMGIIESKPYKILHKEEINEYFKFKNVLDQEYIHNLPSEIRSIAEIYNQRIFVTIRTE
ncbi:hypothetical protein LJC68_08495 [Bacteroidales bacterium OttesenSCG-928-B11]|nr:hypothetical protein [Bacteroidales bacterium OttesenSCG-928-E04]MDL2312898.1 hypothetical protein [Bacteroidales bacterium OttesenSCG-928-B11]MDL2326382.1 hypothetical protein [Bacteroidales bacterium OttesenSCG-928-A14]